jgi:hypothetical protein
MTSKEEIALKLNCLRVGTPMTTAPGYFYQCDHSEEIDEILTLLNRFEDECLDKGKDTGYDNCLGDNGLEGI